MNTGFPPSRGLIRNLFSWQVDSRQLRNPWSLHIMNMGDKEVIIANDYGNRRLLLFAFKHDKLVYLQELVSSDVLDLPSSFHPRRFCLGNNGKVYVGSGYDAPAGSTSKTSGSITVWNVHSSPHVVCRSSLSSEM